ncbi:MAG: hypothetical protein WAW46_15490 [Polaromonas sp.]
MNAPLLSNRAGSLALLAALTLPAGINLAQAAPYPQLDPRPTAQAANPDTPVPATLHHSVFADLPTGVEQTSLDWKKANADVGQFKRGHADLLKWEQEQELAKTQPKTTHQPSGTPTR